MVENIEFPEPYMPSMKIDSDRVFYTIRVSEKGLITEEINRHRANFEKFDDLHKRGLIFERLEDCERYIESLTKLNNKIIAYFNQ
jgi:hypothetical protein|nr:MAG TPA: hypothetical protein [Caudoviricetes sp.]